MRLTLLAAILMTAWLAFGQVESVPGSAASEPDAPSQSAIKSRPTVSTANMVSNTPPTHRFWDRKNVLLFSGIAVFRGLDYASTRNFEARGRQEVLIPDDIVFNSAGFASLEAAGAATSVGISYIFHRTGHHKMERWLSIGHIGVTAFGVGWNYSLKTHRPH